MSTNQTEGKSNVARFFTDNRQIGWVALVATLLWGGFGYMNMPKRKDPDIPVRVGLAICPWPGIASDKVEQLVTRKLEQAATGNDKVERVEATTQDNISVVQVRLLDSIENTDQEFQDIGQRLRQVEKELPDGAGPITWISDFGDTAALMLTVASPPVPEIELELGARGVRAAIEKERRGETTGRLTLLYCYPASVSAVQVERPLRLFADQAQRDGVAQDVRPLSVGSCSGLDLGTSRSDADIRDYTQKFINRRLQLSDVHPDSWGPILIRDPQTTRDRLAEVASNRYSYRQLDDFTDLIQRTLQRVPVVAKVQRVGVLPEQIYLDYSHERLASFDFPVARIKEVLNARNVTAPAGVLETQTKNIRIDATAEFQSTREIGDVLVGTSSTGVPLYLRDLVSTWRGYESPTQYLNHLTYRDASGTWRRNRAVTLAVQMRSGEQIGDFGKAVEAAIAGVKPQLPPDLIVERTSDQPRQVNELVTLLMGSLWEAIALVVIVALVGFWDWRAAMLMAASIPLTLALAFGIVQVMGIDIQQVSIATLIIALGLLVDMPVVAGDAIKRELGQGSPRNLASWIGPSKLAKAIIFATITNIVAYLPFLLLTGDTYFFLYSLPVVMSVTLVASVIVSFTFMPLVAYYLIKPPKQAEEPMSERRKHGFAGFYYRVGDFALRHRWAVFAGSLSVLVVGWLFMSRLNPQFFPKDLSYLSYVDVWAPSDAPLAATDAVAHKAEAVIREEAERFGEEHHAKEVLKALTTFVGGGGPRFWFSVDPERRQLNYAQILIEVSDKHFTNELVGPLQTALSREVPGARIDVRQLETGKPVGIPISIRISGSDTGVLHRLSSELQAIFRAQPGATRARDDWGEPTMTVRLKVDPDRANLSGVTNLDVALSSAASVNGLQVSTYREADKQIPIAVRQRMEDRAGISDIQNSYVYSLTTNKRVPLTQVSKVTTEMTIPKIKRRNQFRTVTVSAFPIPGLLPSQVLTPMMPRIVEFQKSLPPGYFLEIGGEYEEQVKGFKQLSIVMAVSVALIYMALVLQFRSAVKPLLVFAAIPYGMSGAFAALAVMGQPFGFMAFLGVASLVGVIVSHVIVLFDFIEEAHHRGEPLREALLDAGIVRLRPVMITVGATVLGLVPLAIHGGPLWEPLCYAQIGGLTLATFITLLLVPVLYSIFVLDLKLIRWEQETPSPIPARPSKVLVARALMIVLCAAIPASAFGRGATDLPAAEPGGARQVFSRLPADSLSQLSDSLERLACKVSPAVVQVEVTGFGLADDDRRNAAIVTRQHTTGAGVIVDPEGYIMTNAHLVEGAERIRVLLSLPGAGSSNETFAGKFRVLDAEIIGFESQADLALLKVQASNLPALPFNSDHPPQPGQLVFAIGSPNGLRNSVTMGIISSAWRQPDLANPMVYLQTDAPINPGNSGGPLVDVTGAIVGLNTFIVSSAGGSDGLGFAIPARIVDFVYQSLKKYGYVAHIEIGVVAQTITSAMADGLGLAQNWGVVIADVLPRGPADQAGMQPGDVVLAVDGYPMLSLIGFTAALYQHPSYQVLQVDVLRGPEKLSFRVSGFAVHVRTERLADRPDLVKSRVDRLGVLSLDVDDKVRALLPGMRVGEGVVVFERARGFDSVETGLKAGDVIHSLNRTPIESIEQLKSAVGDLKRGDSVVLHIERRGQFQYLAFEME